MKIAPEDARINWKLVLDQLAEKGKGQADFARHIGKTRQIVSRWFNGKNEPPWWAVFSLAEYIGVNASELIIGQEGMVAGIPVVGRVSASGADIPVWTDGDYPAGVGVFGYIEMPRKNRSLFALIVDGDSMSPRFDSGDRVIVDPQASFVHGQPHLIRLHDGRTYLKMVKMVGTSAFRLESTNQTYPPMVVEAEQVRSMFRVVASIPREA